MYIDAIGKFFYFPHMLCQEVFHVKSDGHVYSSADNKITTMGEVYEFLDEEDGIKSWHDERFYPDCNYNGIFLQGYNEFFCDYNGDPEDGVSPYQDVSITDEFWDRYSLEGGN